MAVTGPIQAPVAFNTVYELDDLLKFLAKSQTDMESRFELVNQMVGNLELNDCGLIRFDNIRRMLENAVTLCEDLALFMGKFTHGLIEKKLIKRNSSLPQMNILGRQSRQKRDSGVALGSASSLASLSDQSANELSAHGDEPSDVKTQRQVLFDIMTPSTSSNELEEQSELYNKSLPTMNQVPSKVFVHVIPSDPDTDLTALKAELNNFSTSVLMSHNLDVQLVQSDTVIGLSSRHISTSTESSARSRFRSSNDSVGILAWNNLSRFAIEHSETSDEDNTRLLSSSDSDASIIRYQLKPLIEKRSVDTQTD